MKKYNLSKIMKRAWELVKKAGMSISAGLKKAWKEAKEMKEEIKNVIVESFESYNERRYSIPWVCEMKKDGSYDFSKKVGAYTGKHGYEGSLVVFKPVEGQVYGYGQKDYRGGNTLKNFVKWTGEKFVECNKIGEEF